MAEEEELPTTTTTGGASEQWAPISDLFVYYDQVYFDSCLSERCFVEWSSARMTSCGGTCQSTPGGAIIIRLSKPLLSLRPFEETLDVLLHEMIHAMHFVKNIRDDDPGGHGTLFKAKMREINAWGGVDVYRPSRGYRIEVTHTMIDEVNYYRRHHWKCGRCGDLVRRASNRRPQMADCRGYRKGGEDVDCGDMRCAWHVHQKWCGGEYTKIAGDEHDGRGGEKEIEGQRKKKKKKRVKETALDTWLGTGQRLGTAVKTAVETAVETADSSAPFVDLTAENQTPPDDDALARREKLARVAERRAAALATASPAPAGVIEIDLTLE